MDTSEDSIISTAEDPDLKPQNGLAGLAHFKHDIPAALVVALVSVPLSLGIALASGAPPICGLTSEIVAGLIFPLLGGAYVTVSGPAAGLAPVIFTAIATLGHGDMSKGYHLVLVVIMLAGFVQLLLTYFKAAKFSHLIPLAAIQGMLASIGLFLIAKQLPNFIGHKYHAHEFFGLLAETPSEIVHMEPRVLAISTICLVLLFTLPKLLKITKFKYIPPQLIVVIVGAIIGQCLGLNSKFLVHIPDNPLAHGIIFPDFSTLLTTPSLWSTALVAVLVLTLVDGTESLATIHAVDRIDPFHRKSSPDKTLLAMGISNICSSLIGGLTIIPGIIKSTTNIVSGGRTAWVNFYNAVFLVLFILFASSLINLIPIGALAAILVHIGYKLSGPHIWRNVIKVGNTQLAVFATTILVTLLSDLLIGIFAGMFLEIGILLIYTRGLRGAQKTSLNLGQRFVSMFKSPIQEIEHNDDSLTIHFQGIVSCFNSLPVRKAIESQLATVKSLTLVFPDSVTLVDHSISIYFQDLARAFQRQNKDFQITGFKDFSQCTSDDTAMRYRKLCLLKTVSPLSQKS